MLNRIVKFGAAFGASLMLMGGVASAYCVNGTINNTGPGSYNAIGNSVKDKHKCKNKCESPCRNKCYNPCKNKCGSPCGNQCGSSCNSGCGSGTTNNNSVEVSNVNAQLAATGNAKVKGNTTGGDAKTGDATNTNETTVSVDITNNNSKSCGNDCNQSPADPENDATIENTGPDSVNLILSSTGGGNCNPCDTTTNNNSVSVSNASYQAAVTGNAKVKGNTTGGNATSGNASNSNTTGVTVSLTNNN